MNAALPKTTQPLVCGIPALMPLGEWQLELLHTRRDALVLTVNQGQGRLFIDGSYAGFSPGSVIYIAANSVFAISAMRGSLGRVLTIPPELTQDLPKRSFLERQVDPQVTAKLTSLFDVIAEETSQDLLMHQRAIRAHLVLLSVWLHRAIEHATQQTLPRHQEICRDFTNRLAAAAHLGRSLADHAERLHLSPEHLTRSCAQSSGLTAKQIETQIILHRARMLLSAGSMRIGEIGDYLGFGGPQQFSRFVRQHTKFSPKQIRTEVARAKKPQSP